jgi:hypothetical protein
MEAGNGSEAYGKFPKISGFHRYTGKRKEHNGSENSSQRFSVLQFPTNTDFRFPRNPDKILNT